MTPQVLRIADGVAYEVLDGEAVVLHLPTGTYYRLDEVATRAWEAVVASGSAGPAREELLAEFEVEPSTLDADLAALVDDFVARGLLVVG